jgi:hypothetical protein
MKRLICLTLLVAAAACLAAAASADDETLRKAKAMFFDRRYVEARHAWLQVRDASSGRQAELAAYWVARCSENLNEYERALREYQAYLDLEPSDPALAEEAETSRVGLATRLYRKGQRQFLSVLEEGLRDGRKTVRYYAALQLGGLGPDPGRRAVPVLKEIVESEGDPDLRDRAQLILLRIEPEALRPPAEAPQRAETRRPKKTAGWIKLRVFERGDKKPSVSINVPLGLAELVFKSLPEDAREDLRKDGYDVDNFWEKLEGLGPTEIIEIEGDDGTSIRIWME